MHLRYLVTNSVHSPSWSSGNDPFCGGTGENLPPLTPGAEAADMFGLYVVIVNLEKTIVSLYVCREASTAGLNVVY